MKKITFFAALLVATTSISATAGGLAEPVMEPQIIIEEVETSSSDTRGMVQWLILAAIIVAATAN